MIEPDLLLESANSAISMAKRKRRFKIFDNKPKQPQQKNQPNSQETNQANVLVHSVEEKQQYPNTIKVEIVKVPAKSHLERQFFGEDEEEDLQLLDIKLDPYLTIRSEKFGQTDIFRMLEVPSVMLKNDRIVVNQSSKLYQSLLEIRDNHSDLQTQTNSINQSILNVSIYLNQYQTQRHQNNAKLQQLESFLQEINTEKKEYNQRIQQIDHRLQNIEFMINLQQKHNQPSKQKEELKIFIEENGYQMEVEEDDDQFAESRFLPASVIAQFLQNKRKVAEEYAKMKQDQLKQSKRMDNLQLFHPILQIEDVQYHSLVQFILQEMPHRKQADISFKMLFRRGTTDLSSESVGEKGDLQYKENLLFLIKTSTGKVIGGYISNYLIQEESMQDCHAFLLSLGPKCHKYKVKQECCKEAFMASKFYLITFSSDLMISSNCLEEENYCQWPSSYQALNDSSCNVEFAGDFQFMIEHIEVFQIVFA